MSASLPERVDAERMVAARRSFEGTLPVAGFGRLAGALASDRGEVAYRLDFATGPTGIPLLHVQLSARLTLECQRSLELFELPVEVRTDLGLIRDERDEAGLPSDCEALLTEDGLIAPRRVIEDELLLALPLVPVKPGGELPRGEWIAPEPANGGGHGARPFEGLRALREAQQKNR
jgi:DUF177 domain-containing protein